VNEFKILVIDDEPRILSFLVAKLKASGYHVLTAADGKEGLELVQGHDPDLVVLDIVMPGNDGFQTLQELRAFSWVPVIILSARRDDSDKVKGLNLGADDYLAKPFTPSELVARIEALRRRVRPRAMDQNNEVANYGDLSIDFKKRNLFVGIEERHLTRIEWLLLAEFTQNTGRLLLYNDLLTKLWGPEYRDDTQILRTWVSRLRGKLKKDSNSPEMIRTVAKTGYVFELPAD